MIKHRTLFVINPAAGNGKSEKLIPTINSIVKDRDNVSLILTVKPGHATEIVQDYYKNFRRIICVGGDGTLNEMINADINFNNIIFGVLPVGSGNDFFKNLNLEKNIEHLVRYYYQPEIKMCQTDIAEAEFISSTEMPFKKKFINCLGLGFDANVANHKEQNSLFSGISAYIMGVFEALLAYSPINVNGKFDGNEITGKKLLITIGNGISSGGGFYLTPDADINDGFLDLTVADNTTRLKIIQNLPKALSRDKIRNVKEISMHRFKSAEFSFDKPNYIHADGELYSDMIVKVKVKITGKKAKFICG